MESFWNNRNVLITGCTGFLGWWVTSKLVSQGANVTGLVRDIVPRAPFFVSRLDRQISVVHGSVEDAHAVQRAINEYEIDTVMHLAAQAIVGSANQNPIPTFETNIKGTWVVLEACRLSPNVKRVVVASSDKAYGDSPDLPYREDCPLQGRHPYDVSKSCADLIALAYYHTYGLPVCITRCCNLFGPGDVNYSRIIPGTMRSALRGERPIIRSDGSPMRDYVFVGDVSDGYLRLGEIMEDASIHGRAYNFAGFEPISVLDLTRKILRVAGREDLQPVVLNEAKAEILHQYASAERAEKDLGWRVGASLDDRLAQSFEWYREVHAGIAAKDGGAKQKALKQPVKAPTA